MRSRYVVAWVALFVVLNAAMVWYLRDRMSRPPETAPPAGEPPTPRAVATSDPQLRGPVFLSGAPDGAVLRLTRGDCQGGGPQVAGWIAAPGGAPAAIKLPPVSEVAGVGRSGDSWWVIGADAECAMKAWASDDLAGAAWSEAAIPADAWYLDPQDGTRVFSPRGRVAAPNSCSAIWIQAVGTQIYLVCDDGRGLVAERGAGQFTALPQSAAVVALAADTRGRIGQLMSGPSCLALVRTIARQKIADQHCFDSGKAPLGIAWVGDDLVAQIGFDLMTNAGGIWIPRS
ncbi:MAG: hypothetical protein ABIQ15_08530 [Nocardioides sp.]